MPRICFVTTVPSTLKAFVLETAKYLHEEGEFDISFICDDDAEFANSLPEYIHYFPVKMDRGINLNVFRAVWAMWKIFKEERFDIVQYSTPNASLYASIAARFVGIPIRLYCQWGIVYVGFHGIKRRIIKTIEKLVCRNSTWIEPDSFGNLTFGRDEGLYDEKKSSVVWNGSAAGVSFDKFNVVFKNEWSSKIRDERAIPEGDFAYIYVGRITRDKGINELFAAFKQVLTWKPNVRLILVGPMESEVGLNQDLLSWAKTCSNVVWVGPSSEVEKYLAASDTYVFPSYREGFGVGVIEAQAMNLPVIISDIPGPTDAMKKDTTGLVVKKADVKTLFEAMIKLYENNSLRECMGDAGRKFVEESFERKRLFAKILEDRYRLLKEKRVI